MTGIENHHRRNTPVAQYNDFGLTDVVLMSLVALVVMLAAGTWWVLKNFKTDRLKIS